MKNNTIQLKDGHMEALIYDAAGRKEGVTRVTVNTSGVTKRTNAVTTKPPVFSYYYYVNDHLGNVRTVIDGNGTIKQVNNYYPFGMEYGESSENQSMMTFQNFQFGGKEFDRKYELNLYDFGFRFYDATRGQWTTVDPLAEKYYSISPYAYCANNPIKYTDPTGKWIVGDDGKPVTLTDT